MRDDRIKRRRKYVEEYNNVDLDEAADALDALEKEMAEHNASFDLRWKADMRAINRWQEAHPGNDLVWPDHTDLCVWLLEALDEKPCT